jgi:hypothetical protein
VRVLQVNPADYKNNQRSRASLDLKIVNELSSYSMILIKHFGNNICHYCLEYQLSI